MDSQQLSSQLMNSVNDLMVVKVQKKRAVYSRCCYALVVNSECASCGSYIDNTPDWKGCHKTEQAHFEACEDEGDRLVDQMEDQNNE